MENAKQILLVEYDSADAIMVKRALKDLKVTNPLVHSKTSKQALEDLKNEDNEKPCVILLDLNMPKPNGVEFLKTLKTDKTLKKILVVALTASTKEQDLIKSFKLNVAGYILKPVNYKKFVEMTLTIPLCWTLSELTDVQ